MPDIFRKKWLKYLAEGAFLVWGIVILSLFFYYYPQYGSSFLWILEISLIVGVILSLVGGIAFMFFSIGEFWGLGEKRKEKIIQWMRKIKHKEKITVSFLFFLGFLYACSIIWILYILKRSGDWLIVANDALALVIITILTIVAFSLGYKLIKIGKFEFGSWLEKFLLSEAIGFGALMFIMYFLGMAHLYYRSVAYVLIGSILILTRREILELWNFVKSEKVTWQLRPLLSFKNFLILAIALVTGIYTAGIFQQYPLGWDSSYVYAAFPKAFVANHGIVNAYYFFLSGFPKNGEMLFTLGTLMLNSYASMSGINIIFLFLSGISSYFMAKELFNKKTALLAVFLFFFLPIISDLNITDIKIDLFFLFFCLLAFFYLIKYIRFFSNGHLFLSAIFMGIASGIKYTFFYIVFPGFLLIILLNNRLEMKKKIQAVTVMILFVFILFSPWAIKNYVFSGNPIEPIAGDIFSRDNVFLKKISESYSGNSEAIISDGILYEDQENKNWKFYITFPFKITYNIKSLSNRDILNPGFFNLFLIPPVVFFLIRRKESLWNEGLIFVISSAVFWLFFTQYIQWYLLPVFIVIQIYLAHIILQARGRIRLVLFLVCAIFAMSFAINQLVFRLNYPTLYETQEEADYGHITLAEFINKNVPEGIIWNTGEAPNNYYIRDFESRVIFDFYLFNFRSLAEDKNEQVIMDKLADLNVKYFLFSGTQENEYYTNMLEAAYRNYSTSPNTAKNLIDTHMHFFQFRKNHLELVKQEGNYYLYKLK